MIYNIKDFGAVGDGKTLNTKNIQAAIDECFKNGGGEVQIPEGQFVIGDIRLRSNITLHLLKNAVLLGSENPKDYLNINSDTVEPLPEEHNNPDLRWVVPSKWQEMGGGFKRHLYTVGSYWNYGMIRAAFAENIAIIGEEGSLIDGRDVFDPEGEENYRGPHAINMFFCKNVTFKGYKVINSSNWAHAIFLSEKITFKDLEVRDGHDALHVRCCKDVIMDNCKLITGDDCVAGFGNLNVVVRNCDISSLCSAFRFGGANITIEDCDVHLHIKPGRGRNNMLSFFTNFVTDDLPPLAPPGSIVIRNCKIDGADKFLHLNLSGNEAWQRGVPPTDITFENLVVTNIAHGLCAYGVAGERLDITLRNIYYSYNEDFGDEPFMLAAHLSGLHFENVKVHGYRGKCFIKAWSDIPVEQECLECDIKKGEFIVKADEAFSCNPI